MQLAWSLGGHAWRRSLKIGGGCPENRDFRPGEGFPGWILFFSVRGTRRGDSGPEKEDKKGWILCWKWNVFFRTNIAQQSIEST